MRTQPATEIAEIIVYGFILVMVIIGFIKMVMWHHNSIGTEHAQPERIDDDELSSIQRRLEEQASEKREQKRQKLRLDIAARLGAGIAARPSHGTLTFEMLAEQSFKAADALINRWEDDIKPKEPFVRGEDV